MYLSYLIINIYDLLKSHVTYEKSEKNVNLTKIYLVCQLIFLQLMVF